MFSQLEDATVLRQEIVSLLNRQLEALDAPEGLTDAKLMECYDRQTRVQELRDKLQLISQMQLHNEDTGGVVPGLATENTAPACIA